MNWTELIFLLFISCVGFYGGIGFMTLMGSNPAAAKMSILTFAEYWQHTDRFMAARMGIFGPIQLLLTIATCIIAYFYYTSVCFILMAIALILLVIDTLFVFTVNHPLNQTIQNWDLTNLPTNAANIQAKVIKAFWLRSLLMMAIFLIGLVAFWKRIA